MTAREARMKEQVMRRVRKRLSDDRWSWKGTEFTNWSYCDVGEYGAMVQFAATFWSLKVNIMLESQYRLPNQEMTFTGEEALSQAVEWTADRLLELYETVSARTAPYVAGHERYLMAVKGK